MGEEGKPVAAAGGMVTRPGSGGRAYLLVHRRRYDDWTLPKGKVKEGESPVRAETGYAVRLGGYLGEMRYEVKGVPKGVHLWSMEPLGPPGAVSDPEEVGSTAWLALPEALARLAYPLEREMLAKAAQARL